MANPTTERVMIVSATRTAIGAFGGALKGVDAPTLGSTAIRGALHRAAVSPDDVDEVIMGNVLSAGLGPNPARRAAVEAGIPFSTPALTVNKVCGSGLKAVALACQSIRLGEAQLVAAGGMESMSGAPFLLPHARWGNKAGHGRTIDSMIQDALWDCFYDCHMGDTAENLAEQYGISRQEQDRFAADSQRRCAAAQKRNAFAEEITPVPIRTGKAPTADFVVDEHPRPQTMPEDLARLKPAFRQDGSVTAGNASGINDGAAAVVLMSETECGRRSITPLAQVRAVAVVGVDPRIMGIGPAHAIRKLLDKTGHRLDDIDLLEVNEAFAAQTLAVARELNLDEQRVNVNGGAIALGHPVGASGARILVTLIHEMRRRSARRGIASLCIGGGMGIAALIEQP